MRRCWPQSVSPARLSGARFGGWPDRPNRFVGGHVHTRARIAGCPLAATRTDDKQTWMMHRTDDGTDDRWLTA